MLVFTDRHFNTIVLAGTKDLPLLEDSFNDSLETGTAMLKATLPKTNQDISKITVGSFVFAKGYRNEIVCLEVMEVFEARLEKEIIAEDVGLELLNEEAGNIDMKGTLREFIVATLGSDSSWEIGLNEIDNKTTRTLAYEGSATITKRINMIAGRFGAEVSYSFEEKGGVITRKLINFHKERGRVTGQRLEIGKELEDVQRHISITDLCTAVRPYGEPYDKAVKIAIPYNLLRSSNRESSTRNYKVGEWQLATNIKEGEMVTITFKGVISPLQKFRVYNSGSNHSIGFLEKISDGIYSARLKWTSGQEGNNSLWAYQYPDRGSNNDICKVEWAVMTKEEEVANKWIPSIEDESGSTIPPATNAATETVVVNTSDGDARIEKMVQWFKSREGKVGYNDGGGRFGPDAYDCSSSILISAKHAGLIPSSAPTSNTATMWTWAGNGTHFYQIPASEVRRGDIFISRSASSASSGTGHTGLFLDNGKTIIHTTVGAGKRGIMTTPAKGWIGSGGVRYCRFNVLRDTPTETITVTTKPVGAGQYWTNSQIVHHDIGKTLQGITAQQLNNWIKAKSPSSPFVGQGEVFIEAQKQSGLDARILLAHAAHESAWGNSNIAKKKHNYFGIGAIDSDPFNGASKYANSGLATGIINGAKWIAEKYYNSKYKQTTLYKMRWNNGVHEYATDTAWHTKIANIAKGSEPFTKASALGESSSQTTTNGSLKPVSEIKYEDKTIEVELNLIGYKYDDGRYYVNEKGEICDKEALEKWGRFAKYSGAKSKHILRPYESKATTQKTLLDEGLRFLQQNNEPKVEYEIDLSHVPDGIELGDTVRIIDHDFKPALYLDARLVDLTLSLTDRLQNKAIFSNFEEKDGGINDQILKLQDLARSLAWKLDSQPYEMNLTSSLGNIFKDGIIQTDLRANIIRAGIDQSATMDTFIWERVSAYQDKLVITDEEWNEKHLTNTGNVLTVTNTDVDLEATFTCSAVVDGVVIATQSYTIKDLTIGIYKQEEEPDTSILNWGDVWQWDGDKAPSDGEALTIDQYQEKDSNNDIIPDTTYYIVEKSLKKPFKKMWKGDHWEDVIVRRDIDVAKEEVKEEIELNIGEAIDTKLDTAMGDTVAKVEALEVHLQQFPPADLIGKTAEEINKVYQELAMQKGYLEALEVALESDALVLRERLAIVEVVLGAGKLSMEAITTYFEFGEEGILIGKADEQVKVNITHDSMVFIDGTKETLKIKNNYAYIPNLKVEGLFEFAYHMATKARDKSGFDHTVFRPIKGGTA